MRVRIGQSDTQDDEATQTEAANLTADFADWLTEDSQIALHARVERVNLKPAHGAMSGDLVEWINLVVASGFSCTALVYAHRSFRASLEQRLRPCARMVIEHGGVRLVIEEGTQDDVARLVQLLATQPGSSPTPPQADDGPDPYAGP
ncbi:effector-associated constant component EACC1 [Streptomyces populi]